MDVGKVLRQARDEAGLSQRELAQRAGLTASTVSRYESGAQLPSVALLDRLLAGCGRDLEVRLVERHHDLHAEFARRAGMPWDERVSTREFMRRWFLGRLVRGRVDVLVGGAWAAELHGIPAEPADGRLLVAPAAVPELTAVFSTGLVPWREVEGSFASLPVRPEVFVEHPVARWAYPDVGTFVTEVRAPDDDWPPEVRLPTDDGPLRVVAPLALEGVDGLRPEVLAQWLAWRAGPPTTGPPTT